MKKVKRKINWARIVYFFVLLSFILPTAFLVYRIVFSDSDAPTARSRADYILMLVQCILGVLVMHLPNMLGRRFRFQVPPALYMFYIIFLYCAIFLGEVRSFYYTVPHWDTMLHAFSSMMAGAFGFMVVTILNRSEKVTMNLSHIFVALFAFCFAVSLGAVWEIYEYVFDGILGLNMQKFISSDGTAFVGHAALADTMKDIIIDCFGAFIASAYGYLSLKTDRGWIDRIIDNPREVIITKNQENKKTDA